MLTRALADLAVLVLVCPLVLFVPGFAVVHRLSLPPALTLALSVAVGSGLVYAASFGLYLCHVDTTAFWLVTLLCALVGLRLRRRILEFLGGQEVRAALVAFGVFLLWALALLCTVHHYSGGGWRGDWEEHYQRALFFLEHRPLDEPLVGVWSLTARPPLFNLVAGFLLSQTSRQFFAYQWTATLLNSAVFLGALAALSLMRDERPTRSAGTALLALLALNPSVVENATYLWTRSFTAFLVLLAIVLWWRAAIGERRKELTWAYLVLGLAMATHYSSAPFLLFALLADAARLLRRGLALRAALRGMAALAGPLVPWLSFGLANYGLSAMLARNSSVIDAAQYTVGQNVAKVLHNILTTFVPHFLRDAPIGDPAPRYLLGLVRDYAFFLYQTNLLLMLGSLGWIAVLAYLARESAQDLGAGGERRRSRLVVCAFLAFSVVVGIAVHGGRDDYGVGHICLQPLALLGLVFLAARWETMRPRTRHLLCVGLVIDLVFGIGVQFRVQALGVAAAKEIVRSGVSLNPGVRRALKDVVAGHYLFLGDVLPGWVPVVLLLAALALFLLKLRADAAAAHTGVRLSASDRRAPDPA